MKNKLIGILLPIVLVALVACGGETADTTAPDDTTNSEEPAAVEDVSPTEPPPTATTAAVEEPTQASTEAPAAEGTIEVEVWDDMNRNGVREASELLMDGIVVNLIDVETKKSIIGTTTVDGVAVLSYEPGLIQFQVILPDDTKAFTLREATPDDNLDSDVGRNRGRSPHFTLVAGETITTIDAGIVTIDIVEEPEEAAIVEPSEPSNEGSIEVEVWYDVNQDGIKDGDEPLLDGIEVNLIDVETKEPIIGTTTVNGIALLSYEPGPMQFQVILPDETKAFTLREATTDDNLDSDVGGNRGRSPQFTLVAGETITTIDAGIVDVSE